MSTYTKLNIVKKYNSREDDTTHSHEKYSKKRIQEDRDFKFKKISNNKKCLCGKCNKGGKCTKCDCLCSKCEKCSYDRFHETNISTEESYTITRWGENENKRGKSVTFGLKMGKKDIDIDYEEEDERKGENEVKYFRPKSKRFKYSNGKKPLFSKETIGENEEIKCRWGKFKGKCFCGMCDQIQKKQVNSVEKTRNKIEIKFFKPSSKRYRYKIERECICGGCSHGGECEINKKKEEEELRRREEEERRRRENEERRRKEEERRKKMREEEERLKKEAKLRSQNEERERRLKEEERIKILEKEKLKIIEQEKIRQQENERKRKMEMERLRKLEEERKRQLEEERRRKLEEERRKLEEEKRKLAEERRNEEREKKKGEEIIQEDYERKRLQEQRMLEETRKNLEDKIKYYQSQRKRFTEEIEMIEKGKRDLEKENLKLLEEQSCRVTNNQNYELFTYKDTEIKTFYMEYIQARYKVSEESFEGRKTVTINIRNARNYDNLNENYKMSESKYMEMNSSKCSGCGRISRFSEMKNENSICPRCRKIII